MEQTIEKAKLIAGQLGEAMQLC